MTWIKNVDCLVAAEGANVESEDALHPMDDHRSDKPRVVSFLPRYLVFNNPPQTTPVRASEVASEYPEENIRVGKDGHLHHFVFTSVDRIPADRFIRKERRLAGMNRWVRSAGKILAHVIAQAVAAPGTPNHPALSRP